jgi:ribonuclease HII
MRVLGIDEAGRGCVLGPLFVAGFVAEDVDDDTLRGAGAADSKSLTHAQRLDARTRLDPLGSADVRAAPATAIDDGNLNVLEEEIIVDLVVRWKPDVVVIDALGHPNTLDRIVQRLREKTKSPKRRKWIMEPKADDTYPIVGAASIFAKTTRDAALAALEPAWGTLGSGYPGDPVTKKWLGDWRATGRPWPPFVRTRWETVHALAQVELFPPPPARR